MDGAAGRFCQAAPPLAAALHETLEAEPRRGGPADVDVVGLDIEAENERDEFLHVRQRTSLGRVSPEGRCMSRARPQSPDRKRRATPT